MLEVTSVNDRPGRKISAKALADVVSVDTRNYFHWYVMNYAEAGLKTVWLLALF